MPNMDNPLVPVTVRLLLQHLFHYSAVIGIFLPSHLWYPPGQCGLPHRSITFYLLWLRGTASPTHLQKTPRSP